MKEIDLFFLHKIKVLYDPKTMKSIILLAEPHLKSSKKALTVEKFLRISEKILIELDKESFSEILISPPAQSGFESSSIVQSIRLKKDKVVPIDQKISDQAQPINHLKFLISSIAFLEIVSLFQLYAPNWHPDLVSAVSSFYLYFLISYSAFIGTNVLGGWFIKPRPDSLLAQILWLHRDFVTKRETEMVERIHREVADTKDNFPTLGIIGRAHLSGVLEGLFKKGYQELDWNNQRNLNEFIKRKFKQVGTK